MCLPYPSDPQEAVGKAWPEAEAIFVGQVLRKRRVSSASNGLPMVEVTVAVQRAWKGPVGRTIRVRTASSSVSCGAGFQRGRTYLIFAYHGPGEELYSTSLCSLTRATDAARKYIRALDAEPRA